MQLQHQASSSSLPAVGFRLPRPMLNIDENDYHDEFHHSPRRTTIVGFFREISSSSSEVPTEDELVDVLLSPANANHGVVGQTKSPKDDDVDVTIDDCSGCEEDSLLGTNPQRVLDMQLSWRTLLTEGAFVIFGGILAVSGCSTLSSLSSPFSQTYCKNQQDPISHSADEPSRQLSSQYQQPPPPLECRESDELTDATTTTGNRHQSPESASEIRFSAVADDRRMLLDAIASCTRCDQRRDALATYDASSQSQEDYTVFQPPKHAQPPPRIRPTIHAPPTKHSLLSSRCPSARRSSRCPSSRCPSSRCPSCCLVARRSPSNGPPPRLPRTKRTMATNSLVELPQDFVTEVAGVMSHFRVRDRGAKLMRTMLGELAGANTSSVSLLL